MEYGTEDRMKGRLNKRITVEPRRLAERTERRSDGATEQRQRRSKDRDGANGAQNAAGVHLCWLTERRGVHFSQRLTLWRAFTSSSSSETLPCIVIPANRATIRL